MEEDNKQIVASDSSSNGGRPAVKKRKHETSSSSIKIEVLEFASQKLEKLVDKLEAEKVEDEEKISELEDTVAKLQETNTKNEEEKNQHQAEIGSLNSAIEEHTAKIKSLEDEKQEAESKITELKEEIASMKTIKSEMKESVENEKEALQAEKDELKAEIDELKNQVDILEQNIQNLVDTHAKEVKNLKKQKDAAEKKFKESHQSEQKLKEEKKKLQTAADKEIKQLKTQNSALEENVEEVTKQLSDSEKRNKKKEKKHAETVVAKQDIEQKCKELETKIGKNRQTYRTTIDVLKADKKNLSKTNIDFMNNEKELQKNINEFRKRIEILENDEPEKILSLDEIFNGSKFETSLLSCKSKIVVNITKLEKTFKGWNLYSTTNEMEKPRFLTEKDMFSNCFSMNINGQLVLHYGYASVIYQIMHKINSCELTKLELHYQTIDLCDYIKLTLSKKIEVCILQYTTVQSNNGKSEVEFDQLLSYLPNIKEFKYEYYGFKKDHSLIAKNLRQLEPFSDLQKFEISNLSESFKLIELKDFIKKNDQDVCYTFTFSGETPENFQKEIVAAKNELLKSLSFPCKIRLGFIGKTRLCPIVWV